MRKQVDTTYHAIFSPNKEGSYDVSFPELPGCVTFGRTFEEAREKAGEVLELWLEELVAQGEPVPARLREPIVSGIHALVPRGAKRSYATAHR